MIGILHRVEKELPKLLLDESNWNSLFINYHPPFVERLWREWFEYRIYLHRIHPCKVGEALFHSHPWPSAMRIISGSYEMEVGYGKEKPPVAARIIMGSGSEYEMTNPNGWHSVRPIDVPSLSLMVTGAPWNRSSPKSDRVLQPLSREQQTELLQRFREHYLNRQ